MLTNQDVVVNVVKSFQLAKSDIYRLYDNFNAMKTELEDLKKKNSELSFAIAKMKPAVKVVKIKQTGRKQYVASRSGKNVHQSNCLFARNISKGNRVLFKTKAAALDNGYKLCNCLAY